MKKTFSYLAMTSCFVLSTTLAHADIDSHHGKMGGKVQDKMFKMMDENSDGMVTSDEFNTFNSKKFKELDVNGNGQITLEEMKAGYKKMMDGSEHKRKGDYRHRNRDDAEGQERDDSEMDSDNGKTHSESDNSNSNSKNATRGSGSSGGASDSCCWTPENSGTDIPRPNIRVKKGNLDQ